VAALRLGNHRVEKPWGRRDLAPLFADQPASEPPIGEIWYEDPSGVDRELLVKYLFTSDRLSVQVHPDDSSARSRGFARGKDEAWIILAAEPGATIALGLNDRYDPSAVRAAALDGTIEQMLVWRPVSAGDVIYSPAGTIHAIGKGLTVVEVQQNLDLTYRFYDYGSSRELHLDEALAVADFVPFSADHEPREIMPGRIILAEQRKFVLERWTAQGRFTVAPGSANIWLMPVEGLAAIDGEAARLGDAIVLEGAAEIELAHGATLYVAYPGSRPVEGLLGALSPIISLSR